MGSWRISNFVGTIRIIWMSLDGKTDVEFHINPRRGSVPEWYIDMKQLQVLDLDEVDVSHSQFSTSFRWRTIDKSPNRLDSAIVEVCSYHTETDFRYVIRIWSGLESNPWFVRRLHSLAGVVEILEWIGYGIQPIDDFWSQIAEIQLSRG